MSLYYSVNDIDILLSKPFMISHMYVATYIYLQKKKVGREKVTHAL